LATTIAQASAFGPISVMVLAAIGGVWVPTFAMPEFLQKLSVISPLNWGLESYYGIFIRHSTILDLGTYVLLFIMFSICCFSFTFASLKKQGII
jgi:ABC-2 type transport system permease protein